MKKVLFVAHVVKHHLMTFHLPYLEWFKKNGYETHVCSRNDYENKEDCIIPYCDKYYDLPFESMPFNLRNITAFNKLNQIIKSNNYDIIHCHTPVGGALTRLAAKKARKNGTKVIYTAHGFHFFKGAPLRNWILFYPIEKWLAKYTDMIITINKEDYELAKKSFKAGKIEYIPGVGLDTERYSNIRINKLDKRKELEIPDNAFFILSVGQLNKNKNHETILRGMAKLNNPNIYCIICGQGKLENYLERLINELGLVKQVKLMGYRRDIDEISKAADMFAFLSYREGLSVALMEAMAAGLPIVCSNIRGNNDLIEEGNGGYLIKPNDTDSFARSIKRLFENPELRVKLGEFNKKAIKKCDINNIKKSMEEIYRNI
ncbi:glycosyltransferase family 4 protein [Candidatus Clostridium radicumherbarum]|uniref:Glycosyltransferase family 4 protein n=1 Tax=Candidatus Clostridium radicumherbarum TaxID=3381662 RepID=A0ABW8TTA9_9CLOT